MRELISLTGAAADPWAARSVAPTAPTAQGAALRASEPADGAPPSPNVDVYDHGEAPAPTGRYYLAPDEDGTPKVVFDDPEQQEAPPAVGGPEQSEDAERCTVSTDRVEAEIRQLERQLAELQQQLARTDGDPQAQARLQSQVAQVEDALRLKSTDTYKRQHAEYRTTTA